MLACFPCGKLTTPSTVEPLDASDSDGDSPRRTSVLPASAAGWESAGHSLHTPRASFPSSAVRSGRPMTRTESPRPRSRSPAGGPGLSISVISPESTPARPDRSAPSRTRSNLAVPLGHLMNEHNLEPGAVMRRASMMLSAAHDDDPDDLDLDFNAIEGTRV